MFFTGCCYMLWDCHIHIWNVLPKGNHQGQEGDRVLGTVTFEAETAAKPKTQEHNCKEYVEQGGPTYCSKIS